MKRETTLGERLTEVLKYYVSKGKFTSQNEMAEKWGITTTSISYYVNDKQIPGGDVLQKFAVAFPEINMDWVLTDNGTMLKGKQEYAQYLLGDEAPQVTEESQASYESLLMLKKAKELVSSWDLFNARMSEVRTMIHTDLANAS